MKKYFLPFLPLALFCAINADATPITYRTTLLGSNEDPPNASPGTGVATIVFDPDAFTMQVDTTFLGLLGTVSVAHIHCCTSAPFSLNAGVATQTPTFTGFPTGVNAGTYSHFFDLNDPASWNPAFISANGGTTAGATAALDNGLLNGRAYFNIHSTNFTGGEIRGFFRRVPEPATFGLIILGIGALGLARRKRL